MHRTILLAVLAMGLLAGCAGGALAPVSPTAPARPSTPTAAMPTTLAPAFAIPTETATETPRPAEVPPTLAAGPTVILRPNPITPGGVMPTNPNNPTMQDLIDQAKQDLARRMSAAISDIKVKSAEAVEWPDGSLGCPKPGFMYTQMVTPGYLIVLDVNGTEFRYHGGLRSVFLCEK